MRQSLSQETPSFPHLPVNDALQPALPWCLSQEKTIYGAFSAPVHKNGLSPGASSDGPRFQLLYGCVVRIHPGNYLGPCTLTPTWLNWCVFEIELKAHKVLGVPTPMLGPSLHLSLPGAPIQIPHCPPASALTVPPHQLL